VGGGGGGEVGVVHFNYFSTIFGLG
jgi:hypothetical protein